MISLPNRQSDHFLHFWDYYVYVNDVSKSWYISNQKISFCLVFFPLFLEFLIEILNYSCVHSEAEDDAGVPILPTTVNPDNWDPSKQRVVEYPQVIIVIPLIQQIS